MKNIFNKTIDRRKTLQEAHNVRKASVCIDKSFFKHYGITRTKLNRIFLKGIDREAKILEVGAGIGTQMELLQKMGFKYLFGLEINRKTIEFATIKNIIQGTALDIPFKDNYFDLVFTSGLLVTISPDHIEKVMREICRCSKQYVWGFEYYSDKYAKIIRHNKKNIIWQANFSKLYLNFNLRLIKEKKVNYLKNGKLLRTGVMFLLEKSP